MNGKQTDFETVMENLQTFWQKMPYHIFLGMVIETFDEKNLSLKFKMKEEFIGNSINGGQLHGGVIASIIDATGGMLASISAIRSSVGTPVEKDPRIFEKGGTIDLRVDYLRPGTGRAFGSTGSILRHGKRVVVTRMELTNDRESLIAVGTGTYYIG